MLCILNSIEMHTLMWTLGILLSGGWTIQADQVAVNFTIKNAGLNVEGKFETFEGEIEFDPAQPEKGQVSATVGTRSIDTGIGLRDRHLMGKSYFDAKTHPELSFVSKQISRTADGYVAKGTLTIKGVEKAVEVPFTFEDQVFKASFSLDRRDYGVGGRSLTLGDSVFISLVIPVTSPGH